MKIGNIEVYGVIYKITNKVNGKCYIGQTTNGFYKRYEFKGIGIERVYNYHICMKRVGIYYNKYLLNSIEKHGIENFEVIEIFDIAFSRKELNLKEINYIRQFDSYKNGYNQTLGGEGGTGGSPFKNKSEEEYKEYCMKISERAKLRIGELNSFYGKHHTEETKRKISEANKGKPSPMLGKNYRDYMTEEALIEHDNKISERTKGVDNPSAILYKIIDSENNENIVCGNHIWNDHKNNKIGFLNIHRETFIKYIEFYEEINIDCLKSIPKIRKSLIEKLLPYDGWKFIKLNKIND